MTQISGKEMDEAMVATPVVITTDAALFAYLGGLAAEAGLAIAPGRPEVGDPLAALDEALAQPGFAPIGLCLDRAVDGTALCTSLIRASRQGRMVIILRGASAPDDHAVWEDMIGRTGAILAHSIREFVDITLFLAATADQPLPAGRGVAIVTGGGGSGVNAADLCARLGLDVPPLGDESRERLTPLVPPIASLGNPIDITPQMHAAQYAPNYPQVLSIIGSDPAIDTVFFPMNALTRTQDSRSGSVLAFRHATASTVLLALNLIEAEEQVRLGRAGLYNFVEPERALGCLARIKQAMAARRTLETAPAYPDPAPVAVPATLVDVLREAGVQVPPVRRVASAAEAAAAIGAGDPLWQTGTPAAAIAGPMPTAAALEQARRATETGEVQVRGQVAGRLALRLTARRHETFGPVLTLGAGGLYGALLSDAVTVPAAAAAAEPRAIIEALKIIGAYHKIDRDADLARAANVVAALARYAASPGATGFAIDPLLITADAVTAANVWTLG